MKNSALIQFSLEKQRVERLIICLGFIRHNDVTARASIAHRVGASLLRQCQPAPSDVMMVDGQRSPARDASGHARAYYGYAGRQAVRNQQRGGGGVALRSPQHWDSAAIPDFMGTWCDRLLLGDASAPHRVALLLPQVPAEFEGSSVERVARAHRHLHAGEVLLIGATTQLPFGLVRQTRGLEAVQSYISSSSTTKSLPGMPSLCDALRVFPRESPRSTAHDDDHDVSAMWMGIGDELGPRQLFTAEEERRLEQGILPLSAFAAALWAANPGRSAAYVEERTPTPSSLGPGQYNPRLWKSMQASMLSTRDAAVLDHHFRGAPLDARMSEANATYLAETLLDRLRTPRFPDA